MKTHTNSTWHDIRLEDVKVVQAKLNNTKTPMVDTSIQTSNGLEIYSNTALFKLQKIIPAATPVMLDKEGFLAAKMFLMRNPSKSHVFQTLTAYLKAFPLHKIYLRTISTTQRNRDRRVVASEVLEVIPFLLERQKTTAKKLQVRLEKYQKRWACPADESVTLNTITLPELAAILDDFDIDKSQLTLVPDLCFASEVGYQFHTRNINASISTVDAHGESSIHVSQAVFMLFNGVAMEVDWNTNVECTKHKWCDVDTFRKRLLYHMGRFARMGERVFVKRQELFNVMQEFKMSCQYRSREKRPFTPGLDLLYCDYSDKVRLSYIFIKCQEFGFKHIVNTTSLSIPALDEMYVPAWKARFIFMVLWMDMFFDKYEPSVSLRKLVDQALSFKIPSSYWTEDCDPLELVFSSDPEVLRIEKEVAERNAVDLFESAMDTNEKYAEITHNWFNEGVVDKWLANRNIIRCKKWDLQNALHNGMKSTNKLLSDYKVKARKEFPKDYPAVEEMTIKANAALIRILVENRRNHAARPEPTRNYVMKVNELNVTKTADRVNINVVISGPNAGQTGDPDEQKAPRKRNVIESTKENEFARVALAIASQFDVEMNKKVENRQHVLRKVNALNEKAKRGVKTLRVSRQLRLIVSDAHRKYAALYYDLVRTKVEPVLQKRFEQ